MHHSTDRIAHTTAFVTPVLEHWLEREIAQWVHPMKDRSDDPSHNERTLLPRSYISLLMYVCMYMYVCIYVCLFVYMYICIYVCMCVCLCVFIYVCVSMYVHIYVCMYIMSMYEDK